jgi:hypothetical protein
MKRSRNFAQQALDLILRASTPDSYDPVENVREIYVGSVTTMKKNNSLLPDSCDNTHLSCTLNQSIEDSYTFSLAVELLPSSLSIGQRSRKPLNSSPVYSSTSQLEQLTLKRTASEFSKSFTLYLCPVVRFSH